MIDVDAFTWRFGPLIATHCTIAKILHDRDIAIRLLAYEVSTFLDSAASKLTPPLMTIPSIPVLSSTFIQNITIHEDIYQIDDCCLKITTSHILFLAPNYNLSRYASTSHNTNEMRIAQVASSFSLNGGVLMILKVPQYYGDKLYLPILHGGTSDFNLAIKIGKHYLIYFMVKMIPR